MTIVFMRLKTQTLERNQSLLCLSCLKELMSVCISCKRRYPVYVDYIQGTLVSVSAHCENISHTPLVQPATPWKIATWELMTAAAVLSSGNSPTKALWFLATANVKVFCLRYYMAFQDTYFIPATYNVYCAKRDILLTERQGNALKLGGDGRCCSLGHTAKYGSYSVMDLQDVAVLDMQLV